jgi:hypothetical protein
MKQTRPAGSNEILVQYPFATDARNVSDVAIERLHQALPHVKIYVNSMPK